MFRMSSIRVGEGHVCSSHDLPGDSKVHGAEEML